MATVRQEQAQLFGRVPAAAGGQGR